MSISQIEIENYKSIKHCALALNDINLLIGENGTGKTNVLDAVWFFFRSLLDEADDEGAYNYQNMFCNEFIISITFDFSHLQKISRSNRNRDADSDYLGYYKWINRRGRTETLKLHKIKGKPARWNRDRKYRQNVFNLFPLYFVDAREVNLTDWSQLWDIIGDLMKVHRAKETEIAAAIDAIKNTADYKLEERFHKLSGSFERSGIQIKPYTPKQYASAISALLFKGSVFEFKKNKLNYMSNGTNAFNYTNLLIEILKLISEFKIKDPIVILDEPETSLHHKLIDQLTGRVFGCNGAIRFLIASHSPRLLKNIIRTERRNCEIVHVSSCELSTCAAPISLFSQEPDERPRTFMTDQHANAYFSRYILSVEGVSEIEVFSNEFLQELFPFLKNVDIMEGMSNDIVQKIISPRQRRFQTRFLLLMDMDKAVTKRKGENRFDLSSKYFSAAESSGENYYYSAKRTEQVLRKKRIAAMAQSCRFHFWYPFLSCNDPNFIEWINMIKAYLSARNIYVAATTVEGMLITYSNLDSFWEFFQMKHQTERELEAISNSYCSFLKNDRLNFMRLLFSGKSDYILNLDEIRECNPQFDPELYRVLSRNRAKKTEGWMTQWLNYSICESVDIDSAGAAALAQLTKKLAEPVWRKRAVGSFYKNFPELGEILGMIQRQLEQ